MTLLQSMLDDQPAIAEMARTLGVGEADARRGLGALLPSLARGLSRNAQRAGGLDALLDALGSGGHGGYADDPSRLGRAETVRDGNGILAHILGSKDVSRNVAGHAAEQTGIGSDVLRKMLPLVAAAAMGALNRQTRNGGALGELGARRGSSSHLGGVLHAFLDADRDGSIADDLLNLARRFF